MILRWAKTMHLDLSTMPRLLAFKARMEARPAVQKALAEEGLTALSVTFETRFFFTSVPALC